MQYRRMAVPGASYFFTVVTYDRRPLFAEARAVALLQEAIQRLQEKRPFVVEAQVVLPDHLHGRELEYEYRLQSTHSAETTAEMVDGRLTITSEAPHQKVVWRLVSRTADAACERGEPR